MKQIFTIFQFTFIHAAKKKAFIISTVVMILLIALATALPKLLAPLSAPVPDAALVSDTASNEIQINQTCYYIDEGGLLTNAISALAAQFEDTAFIAGSASQMDAYSNEIQNNGDISAIVVTTQENQPFIRIITKNFRSGISASRVADVLSQAHGAGALAALGVDEEAIAAAQAELPFASETLNDNDLSGYLIGVMAAMLMFFAIYFYSYSVAMSVAGEKTSRVMETLVVAAKPSRILIGKCLAMGTLGLTQFFLIIASALVCYRIFISGEFVLLGTAVNLSMFTPQTIVLLILYFILGYTLFAMMNAVCGALVSKVEDLNPAMMPVTLIALASFYLGFFTASSSANGMIQKIALYVPFSAPFYVPSRLLSGDISAPEIAISFGLLLLAIVIVTIVSMRVYSATVLSYGKSLKLKELVGFAK